jgi:type VI secretion system secreted protein Hcp
MNRLFCRSNLCFVVIGCSLALAATPSCFAQNRILLRVDGIPGESTVLKHEGEIDCLNFSLSLSNSGTSRAVFQDLNITKWVDKASPTLMLRCAEGADIPSVVLFVESTGAAPRDYYTITLSNCRVTSETTGGSGSERPAESVSFTYEAITVEYKVFNADGSIRGTSRACYNRLTGRSC